MKLVIFDCDGVLVNSETIYIASELEFLRREGLFCEHGEYIETFTGLPPDVWRSMLVTDARERVGEALEDDFFEALDRYVMGRFETELEVVPGAWDSVANLGYKCCVASSTPYNRLCWKLSHTGLVDLFIDAIFSSDMVKNGKPEPDLFLHAARIMEEKPENCIVVEDSCNGVLAGKAANMAVIGFSGGDHCLEGHVDALMEAGADCVIGELSGLKSTIDQMM